MLPVNYGNLVSITAEANFRYPIRDHKASLPLAGGTPLKKQPTVLIGMCYLTVSAENVRT